MNKILITCPPMLKEPEQINELAQKFDMQATEAEVIQTLTEQELLELLPEYDGWIAGDDPASRTVIQAARGGKLRAIVKWGIGVDNIDLHAVEEFGLQFANTPGMFSDEVADLAYGYLINLVRKITQIDKSVRAGQWIKPQGMSLRGKTAGVVGLGNIGKSIIARLHTSGVSTIGYDPFVEALEGSEIRNWPEDLGRCDFLFLACALTESNQHLVNSDAISHMKPGAYLINVSRGPLIDERALLRSMQDGHIAGCALDVFENEPLDTASPFALSDQTVLGSHNASNTKEAVQATNERAMSLLHDMLSR
ncbi:MAG: hypothetical protein NXH95_10775 [Pseudomonadaceae bacterium]|nr:hypothetical protein [Pseudomonadaceae bacterium]